MFLFLRCYSCCIKEYLLCGWKGNPKETSSLRSLSVYQRFFFSIFFLEFRLAHQTQIVSNLPCPFSNSSYVFPILLKTVSPFHSYCKIALTQVSMPTDDRIMQGMFSQPSLWNFIGTTFLSCKEDTSQKQIPCPLHLTFFPPVSSIMFPEP